MTTIELAPRAVAASVEELLADATDRQPFSSTDSKSGSAFERVLIAGEPHVVKYLHVDSDWTMRTVGDVACRPVQLWRTGILDALPPTIDHAIVGAAGGLGRNGWGGALLMRDVSAELIPPGDEIISLEHHLRFVDHLADLSVRFWGWEDTLGLTPHGNRYCFFSQESLAVEESRGHPDPVPSIAARGWNAFRERVAPEVRDLVLELRREPAPIVDGLRGTPTTFLHGDWKMGNIGAGHAGTTVLIDWAYSGFGPPCHELAWYLALNRARLPQSKEAAIEELRGSFERRGVDTTSWFDRQMGVCLLGCAVIFGWEKALGDDDELLWWCDRAAEGAGWL